MYLALLLLLVTTACHCHIDREQVPLQNPHQYQHCGRRLARLLAEICYDDAQRKPDTESVYNAILPPLYYKSQEPQLRWPWMVLHNPRGMAMGTDQATRAKHALAIAECCDKPCSVNEILSYC